MLAVVAFVVVVDAAAFAVGAFAVAAAVELFAALAFAVAEQLVPFASDTFAASGPSSLAPRNYARFNKKRV